MGADELNGREAASSPAGQLQRGQRAQQRRTRKGSHDLAARRLQVPLQRAHVLARHARQQVRDTDLHRRRRNRAGQHGRGRAAVTAPLRDA